MTASRRAVLISAVVLAAAVLALLGLRPGALDGGNYELLVRKVEAVGLTPGEARTLRWNGADVEPDAREPQAWWRDGVGSVLALRTEDGRLVVRIVTDVGRALLYASGPLRPEEIAPSPLDARASIRLSGDCEWWIGRSRKDHWWELSRPGE